MKCQLVPCKSSDIVHEWKNFVPFILICEPKCRDLDWEMRRTTTTTVTADGGTTRRGKATVKKVARVKHSCLRKSFKLIALTNGNCQTAVRRNSIQHILTIYIYIVSVCLKRWRARDESLKVKFEETIKVSLMWLRFYCMLKHWILLLWYTWLLDMLGL